MKKQYAIYIIQAICDEQWGIKAEGTIITNHTLFTTNFLSKHTHIPTLYVPQKYQQCKQYTHPKQNQSNVGTLGQ